MAVLVSAYPRTEIKQETLMVYSEMLIDLDIVILEQAVKTHLSKSNFFPTVAELRESYVGLLVKSQNLPLPAEAYDEAIKAQPDYCTSSLPEGKYDSYEDKVKSLVWVTVTHNWSHPIVKEAALLMGWRETFPSDNPVADRAQFFKVYESLVNRFEEEIQMLPSVKQTIFNLSASARNETALLEQ